MRKDKGKAAEKRVKKCENCRKKCEVYKKIPRQNGKKKKRSFFFLGAMIVIREIDQKKKYVEHEE